MRKRSVSPLQELSAIRRAIDKDVKDRDRVGDDVLGRLEGLSQCRVEGDFLPQTLAIVDLVRVLQVSRVRLQVQHQIVRDIVTTHVPLARPRCREDLLKLITERLVLAKVLDKVTLVVLRVKQDHGEDDLVGGHVVVEPVRSSLVHVHRPEHLLAELVASFLHRCLQHVLLTISLLADPLLRLLLLALDLKLCQSPFLELQQLLLLPWLFYTSTSTSTTNNNKERRVKQTQSSGPRRRRRREKDKGKEEERTDLVAEIAHVGSLLVLLGLEHA